jgi:hypothetical protein
MSRIAALSPEEARRTLINRMGPRVDRLRQIAVRLGAFSKRVFLTWTVWSGEEQGSGQETIFAQVEILPTPRVVDLTSILRNPRTAGYYEEGSVRVDQISIATYTEDMLRGLVIPDLPQAGCPGCCAPPTPRGLPLRTDGIERGAIPRVDFFYQVVEDGRGDQPAERRRFRPQSLPYRDETNFQFAIILERADEELDRQDRSQVGADPIYRVLTP